MNFRSETDVFPVGVGTSSDLRALEQTIHDRLRRQGAQIYRSKTGPQELFAVTAEEARELALQAGVSRETVRLHLYRAGVLGLHRRYVAVRERLIAKREATAWAAE